jgi:hypothetical protein
MKEIKMRVWRMDEENVVSIHNGTLCSHEEE